MQNDIKLFSIVLNGPNLSLFFTYFQSIPYNFYKK